MVQVRIRAPVGTSTDIGQTLSDPYMLTIMLGNSNKF